MTVAAHSPSAFQLRTIGAHDAGALEGLCDLLIDAVRSGASVGFLWPLDRDSVRAYWKGVLESASGDLTLWAAEDEGRIVHVVLDRSFVAGGCRYIVDFKTGAHEGADYSSRADRK